MSFPRIKRILLVDGTGSCWQEDIGAIRESYAAPGERWTIPASTPGMKFIRQPSRVVQIGLQMENGETAWGDCLSVSFAGKSGRDVSLEASSTRDLLDPPRLLKILQESSGKGLGDVDDALGREFPRWTAAIRFGVSQAVVNATAISTRTMPFHVLRDTLGIRPETAANGIPVFPPFPPVPALQGSCGNNWRDTVERMIVAGIEYLPQGQFEDLDRELGQYGSKIDGSKIFEYIDWLKKRIGDLASKTKPRAITLDFHGALAQICSGDMDAVAAWIKELARRCQPFPLHVESPVVESTFEAQINSLVKLKTAMRAHGANARIIADEWANSLAQIERLAKEKIVDGIHIKMPDTGSLLDSGRAVQVCKDNGLFVILGGSCTETATSSRLAAHLGMATQPDAILVKPGISFDEGFSLMKNELLVIQSLLAVSGAFPDSQDSTRGNVSTGAYFPATMSVWP
ncbi:hypothetical protein EBZ80_06105 [bacterium]|nr:hypothetical protein [bacterium]